MNARIRSEKPMSTWSDREKSYLTTDQDYREAKDAQGNRITRYSDGSSTVHGGGPAGSMNYDEFGEEC